MDFLFRNAVEEPSCCETAPQPQPPAWSREAVWYQIFPERFRNGHPASNPEARDFSTRDIPGWKISDWGMDWYRQDDWERRLGDFRQSVFHRRFGGDLIGVREKLDYLQDLGVNAIYLNPVFHAASLHKYDATSYHHIDPAFGPDRAGDIRRIARAGETEDPATWIWTEADLYFLELVRDIHRRGMRVIIDGVFNHTGRDFFAFQDLLKHGRSSRYADWYLIKEWRDARHFDYDGWFGIKDLPELGRDGHTLAKPVRQYIFDITRRWMDPSGNGDLSSGIDGWRLDVAFCVPHAFWKEWRTVVKGINPEAYTTGEIVHYATDYLQGDELDAVMNYMWAYPVTRFFIRGTGSIGATEARNTLRELLKVYPRELNYGLQNLFDSHDTARILTIIANPDKPRAEWRDYFEQYRVADHPSLLTRRPQEEALAILRQMLVMQMTYLGAPMIYYGDEVGMWGANDPDDRQPMLWDDSVHEQVERDIHGESRPVERKPDTRLFDFYRRAIRLRKENPALNLGGLDWLETGSEEILGFERQHKRQCIAVFFNVAKEPRTVEAPYSGRDLWTGESAPGTRLAIPATGWRIIEK